MLNALLIDDEPACLDSLEKDLAQYCPSINVLGKCASAKEGLQAIKKHNPDLVFLDIEMPWMNGFELLETLENITFEVVFITAYDQYALRAFRISAADYLLKPVDKDDLIAAVQKVMERKGRLLTREHFDLLVQNLQPQPGGVRRIGLPTRDGYDIVPVADVIYCEADGNYSHIYLAGGKKMFVTRSMKDLENTLEEHAFCRIHHAFLVNINHCLHYQRGDGGSVSLTGGATLPVSRAKKEEFLEKLGI